MTKDSFFKDILEGKKYSTDLLIIILLSILAAICALAFPKGNSFRIIFAILMLIFFPGYAFVSVLWPGIKTNSPSESSDDEIAKIDKRNIDNMERIALSFGLSIAIVSILGLALNYTSFGITMETSLISNLLFIMIFAGLAFFRRSKLPVEERFHTNLSLKSYKLPNDKTEKALILIIAICLIASVITLGYAITTPSVEQHYSKLYILDANGRAENYTFNTTVNDAVSIIVGIVCHEYEMTDYILDIGLEGSNTTEYYDTWNLPYVLGNETVARRQISLNHQEVFQETFNFQLNEPGRHKIVWQLMINGETTDYEVHLWVNVNAN